jgi:hypothetical protein
MMVPEQQLLALGDKLRSTVRTVLAVCRRRDITPSDQQPDPESVGRAIDPFIELIGSARQKGTASAEGADDAGRVGECGLGLITEISFWTRTLGLEQQQRELELLSIPLALWVVEHGGQLTTLEPVVNGLALTANSTRDPEALERLSVIMEKILQAAHPRIRQDPDKSNPWRVLNLNRAIVATRTHRPELMEQVFQTLTRRLPEDAAAFFREGMQQMGELDYPPEVRTVMKRYFDEWSAPSLH